MHSGGRVFKVAALSERDWVLCRCFCLHAMAAPTANLVPITRAFLSKFYDQHPFEPISEDVKKLQTRLQGLQDELENEWSKQGAGREGYSLNIA